MKRTLLAAAMASSLSLSFPAHTNGEELFYSAFYDAENKPVRELEENKDYRLEIYARKKGEPRKTWALGCGLLTVPELSFQAIAPKPHYTNGMRPDFFINFAMDPDNFVDDIGVRRYTADIIDPIRSTVRADGPLDGEGVIGMYTVTVKTNAPLTTRILGTYLAGDRDLTNTRHPVKSQNKQYAIVPKNRTQSILLIEKERESDAWVYATGTKDEQGKPRSMVLQRSTNDITGPWQNILTNSITAENPYGSINFVDTAAKGLPSVFYRAVSLEMAKQAGKATPESASWTSAPGR